MKRITKNQIEKPDMPVALSKEHLTKFKCDINKGEGICDCCDTSGHNFLYKGFQNAAFYSFSVCSECLYKMMRDKGCE